MTTSIKIVTLVRGHFRPIIKDRDSFTSTLSESTKPFFGNFFKHCSASVCCLCATQVPVASAVQEASVAVMSVLDNDVTTANSEWSSLSASHDSFSWHDQEGAVFVMFQAMVRKKVAQDQSQTTIN